MIKIQHEKFVKGFKSRGTYQEIFKNPSRGEIKACIENNDRGEKIRFVTDPLKDDVYVASMNVLHDELAKKAGLPHDYTHTLSGLIKLQGSKIVITSWGNRMMSPKIDLQIAEDILKGEYDYMKAYNFDIDKLKEETNLEDVKSWI